MPVGNENNRSPADEVTVPFFNGNNQDLIILEAPLPVTLVSFKVINSPNGALLKWETTDEVNVDHFELLKSNTVKSEFASIASVQSGGSSYEYLDQNASKGENYYKLKTVNTDGSFELSPIISLSIEYGLGEHLVFPNPATNNQFSIKNYFEIDSYKIVDASGKVVNSKLMSSPQLHTFKVLENAGSNFYILEYKVNSQKFSKRVMLK